MRFLFVDRILQLTPGKTIQGIKHITQDDYYLTEPRPLGSGTFSHGHGSEDDNRLCFMPSLVGETLGQLAAWNVMLSCDFKYRPVAGVVSHVHLHRPAFVGETLYLESVIDALGDTAVQYHSVARVGEDEIFRIDGALGPLLPMNVFIDDEWVRRQFDEINRPGDYTPCAGSLLREERSSQAFGTSCVQFDAIIESVPGISLSAVKRITRAAPYFADHFPNKPVLPMTILLECKSNLAREFLARAGFAHHYQLQEIRKIKMNGFVQPGDIVITHIKVKEHNEQGLVLNFRSDVDGKRVCVLDMILGAKK